MIGQGVGGVIVGAIRVITKAAMPNDTQISTLIYFYCGAFVIILNIVGYLSLKKLSFASVYMNKVEVLQKEEVTNFHV